MEPDKQKKTDTGNKPDASLSGGEWTKEDPEKGRLFDFDAFLGEKSLEDRVTEALDGKDVLDEQAGGQYPPGYIPRRSGGGDRGRHEAPEPEPEPEYPGDPPTQRFSQNGGTMPPRQGQQSRPAQQPYPGQPFRQGQQPRQNQQPRPSQPPRPQRPANEPPPRPKVVVAEPTPRVVVTPERQYQSTEQPREGMGKGMKFLIALLISVAVVLALAVLAIKLLPSGGSGDPNSPAPSPTDYLFGGLPTRAPAVPTVEPAPTTPPATATPIPTPVPVIYYSVTVTAGPGGSVSPSGMVDVQEGDSVTFTITPDGGCTLAQLLIDGSNVSVADTYTFTDVHQNHTIYAVFQQTPPTAPPPTDVPVVTDVPVPSEEPDLPPAVEE